MKFKTRIWMLPISAAVVFTVGVAISVFVGLRASSHLKTLSQVENPYLEQLLRTDRGIEAYRLALQSAAAEGDAAKLKDAEGLATAVRSAVAAIGQLKGRAEDAKALDAAFEGYARAATGAVQAMLEKKDAQALASDMQAQQAAMDKLYKDQEAAARTAIAHSFKTVDDSVLANLYIAGCTGLVALLVLGLASRLIVSSVWRDLGDEPETLRELVHRVAAGDLDVPVGTAAHERSLLAAVGSMVAKLHGTVASIRTATETISLASTEIAAGNQDLSSRTEYTAADLQQTAGSVQRLTETVRQSADSAQQASTLASSAMSAAQDGGKIVSDVVHSMQQINEASRRISEIIGVIDSIAFQTNILALNAAVEAARAGEQGRGFAVVAGEVRALAQRCANAAREIKSLIGESGVKVEGGTKLVNNAGEAMRDILARVERVNQIIADISHVTSEQSQGIGQVNSAVNKLDQMTQQNAALVEQSAAASESLKEQTSRLTEAVSAFRLAHG